MWNLTRVTGQNIFSYKDIDYTFLQNKCTLIYGKNKTDPGTDSNGSGKSTIIELITLLITGSTCRDVDKSEFINDDSDIMSGELFMENKVLKKTLSIKRIFFRGSKSSSVYLTENDVINNNITSVLEANKRILELVGITKEDLMNYFIIGQDSVHSFFTAGDSEKKEIINRLTSADILYDIIKENDNKKNKLEFVEKKNIEIEISNIQIKIESKEEAIEYEKGNFIKEIDVKIKALKDENDEINEQVKKFNEKLEHLKKLSDLTVEEIKKNNQRFIKNLDADLSKFKLSLSPIKDQQDELISVIRELKLVISGEIVCPKCDNHFTPDYAMTAKEAEGEIEVAEKLIEENKVKIKKIEDSINLIKQHQLFNDQIERDIRALKVKLSDNDDDQKSLGKAIKKQTDLFSDNIFKINKLEADKKKPSRLNNLKSELDLLSSQLDSLNTKLSKKEAEIEMVTFWKHHLGRKGFLTYLANKALKSIEGITNYYLKRFDTSFSIVINGYTELKTGDIRDKIEIFVQNRKGEQKRFARHSGGEKGRIDLAGIVGIQKLINMSCNGGGLNFLVLDEKFDGLDSSGQHQIVSILQNIGVTTIIISHRNNSIGAENELFVEKINGVSFISSVSNN